ncbi:apolipoprotein N-acyltransferase [Rhodobacteraceae bacterium MCCB 386]|nr:apolipoprotein N-acyltransferase [Roseitranquillus sediminis]
MPWRRELGVRGTLAVAVALGALAALGQVPFALPPALLLGLAGATVLLRRATGARQAAWIGWAFGVGYFALALHWIVEPFLIDPPRHGWMAPFALLFSAFGFSLFWAAAFAGAGVVRPARRPLALVLTLTAGEGVRSVVLGGFPWALIAYGWSETPAIHAAALVGPHGLTLLTLLAAVGLAQALRRKWMPALASALPLAAVAAAGWWLAQAPLVDDTRDPIVRLVQPNAPQQDKWDPERARVFFERQVEFTAAGEPPDLVVWPETAIPWWLDQAGPALERASVAARGATLVLGAQRAEEQLAFNSLVVVDADGRQVEVYDKHHLVPFGEYIPLGGLGRWLGLRSFAAQDGYGFSAGPGARLLDLGPLGRPLPLICYEAIFPQEVAGAPERPDWLLQVTNDAWFGTFSGPYQHLAQARFRAVEQGLPMIRVANTGVSAVIDARGRVLRSLPLGRAGYIDAALPAAAPPTLYARTGNLPVLVVLLLGAAAFTTFRNRD